MRFDMYMTEQKRISHEEGLAKGIVQGHEKGLAEGIVQGHEKGLAEGIVQGREKGLAEGITRQLEKDKMRLVNITQEKFIDVTSSLVESIKAITSEELLDTFYLAFATSNSLKEFEEKVNHIIHTSLTKQ